MATVTYNFIPNQAVWVITASNTVYKGVVTQIKIDIISSSTEVQYGVMFNNEAGSGTFLSEKVFGSKAEAITALTALIPD